MLAWWRSYFNLRYSNVSNPNCSDRRKVWLTHQLMGFPCLLSAQVDDDNCSNFNRGGFRGSNLRRPRGGGGGGGRLLVRRFVAAHGALPTDPCGRPIRRSRGKGSIPTNPTDVDGTKLSSTLHCTGYNIGTSATSGSGLTGTNNSNRTERSGKRRVMFQSINQSINQSIV